MIYSRTILKNERTPASLKIMSLNTWRIKIMDLSSVPISSVETYMLPANTVTNITFFS